MFKTKITGKSVLLIFLSTFIIEFIMLWCAIYNYTILGSIGQMLVMVGAFILTGIQIFCIIFGLYFIAKRRVSRFIVYFVIFIVATAAVGAFVVLTWKEYKPPPSHTPDAKLTVNVIDGNYTINVTNITESIPLHEVTCIVRNTSYDPAFESTIDNLTKTQFDNETDVVFLDNDMDGNLSIGDQFRVKSKNYGGVGEPNGKFMLEYCPTKSIMGAVYFPKVIV